MDLAMRVTSLYPRMRSMGTTKTRDVRNWGPSWVATPLRGGDIAPDTTIADTRGPRARSSSRIAWCIVESRSSGQGIMGLRTHRWFKNGSEGADRKPSDHAPTNFSSSLGSNGSTAGSMDLSMQSMNAAQNRG